MPERIRAAAMNAAANFAHLLGMPRAEEKPTEDKKDDPAAEDKCPEKGADETDEDYETRKAAWEKDHAKKAETEDEEDKKEEDETVDGKAARARERARCAAILLAPSAAVRPDVAAQLATQTTMPVNAAIAILNSAAAGHRKGSTLADRMGQQQLPQVGAGNGQGAGGAGGPASDAAALAARMSASYKKAKGIA